ncbi:MAG TPA: rod shape-determining protein MreD [Acidimicrobiia bacterium]|nr:rod shape-determining protein MreD [Acidimicrobiia bacterium]
MRSLRMLALIVVVVLVQVTVFPHLRIAGVAPDLGLVVALAVGYHDGPEAGAIAGFVAGFGFDLFLETPLGLDALAYALVGYGVGIIEGGLLRSPRWLPSVLGVAGGLAGGLILIGIGVLAGVENVKGTHGVQTIAIAALYDGLLAPFVFFAVTRTVGRADDIRTSWSIR